MALLRKGRQFLKYVIHGFFTSSCYHGRSHFTTLSIVNDNYNGVTVNCDMLPQSISGNKFKQILSDSLVEWERKHSAVWLNIPISYSSLIPEAVELGFQFHHAEGNSCTMTRWLDKTAESQLPMFASHQVGVAGCVLNDKNEVLVVQEKKMRLPIWKFPGGLSNLGEDIGKTAEREVFEETGVETEFKSIICFRQQHTHPGAFGRSDLFFLCRMKALTENIRPCPREIRACQWMDIQSFSEQPNGPALLKRFSSLIEYGLHEGFHKIDLQYTEFQSIYKGLKYKMFHANLPENWKQ
ncbi:nucleoside diphosphate-linked moiety X motif 6-like [Tubulanus polymorphus]|uniref:nucleoside diphosphate-linked moiety X motif 6-like n=1 Tax=Tubulanus polymorphus TaxID=672921 RepID=UPI003DA625CB